MRVLMVFPHVNFFRSLGSVARELDARGHTVTVLHGTRGLTDAPEAQPRKAKPVSERKERKANMLRRTLALAQAELPAVTFGYRPEPEESWQRRLRAGRRVVNRSIYFQKAHPAPSRTVEGLDKMLSPRLRKHVSGRVARTLLARPLALRLWRAIEAASRPSRTVVSVLEELKPDVVVLSPTVWAKEPVESDYVRAARALRIPTVGFVASWDNLTSKGTIHVVPDVLAVWNEQLAQEAVELHHIPRNAIHVVGAPYLDEIFELEQTVSAAEMCAEMGCPDDREYVLYLCSSPTLIASEVEVVTALADALRLRLGDNAPLVVVRPHPVNPTPWEDVSHPDVAVFPKQGDLAAGTTAWQEYYNQLTGASCCIGLNTTAFLEAAIADRPCLTIQADEFQPVQGRTGHFRHLLAGGFLEVCGDVGETAERIERILAGADDQAEGRRAFVEAFLRPAGVEQPVAPNVADLVESLAVRGVVAPRTGEEAPRDLALAGEERR